MIQALTILFVIVAGTVGALLLLAVPFVVIPFLWHGSWWLYYTVQGRCPECGGWDPTDYKHKGSYWEATDERRPLSSVERFDRGQCQNREYHGQYFPH